VNADGSGNAVAKIIEYYIPESFRKQAGWIPPEQRGKVIPFHMPQKKSETSLSMAVLEGWEHAELLGLAPS